jgi:hypothetical protein
MICKPTRAEKKTSENPHCGNEAESSCNVPELLPELPDKPSRLYSSDPFSALHTKPAGIVEAA